MDTRTRLDAIKMPIAKVKIISKAGVGISTKPAAPIVRKLLLKLNGSIGDKKVARPMRTAIAT